jgi:hypothetical protein
MKLRLSWRYLAAFLFLTILCGTSHEFVHHFAGRLVCGCWGYKTFNSFELCASCATNPYQFWPTVAGPAFTFGLMWVGLYQLRKADEKNRQLGFALIFANFPINRMFFALIGYNDEQWVARYLYGDSQWAFWITNVVIWAVAVPPLLHAYRAIKNRRRVLWFLGFFVLPFVFVILFAGMFLEDFLLLNEKFLATTVIGIPYLILLVEIVCLAGFYAYRKSIYASSGAPSD